MNPGKFKLVIVFCVLVMMALACALPGGGSLEYKTGATQTQSISVPLPADAAKPTDVTLRLAAADVKVGAGAAKLVEGTVQYNVSEFLPTITASGNQVEILQGPSGGIQGIPPKDIVNEWDLKFSNSAPLNLTVQAGAYEGTWSLGGLRLQSLTWAEGVSESTISFGQANPEKMDLFSFTTGASKVKFENLANLNFTKMSFQGGVGAYTFDFGGKLQQSTTVDLKTGASEITIVIPKGAAARVSLKGAVANVKTLGAWSSSGTTYTTDTYDAADIKLDINMDMGVGQLILQAD